MVEGGGFEPPKVEPADLQSDPFGRSGTPPSFNLGIILAKTRTVKLFIAKKSKIFINKSRIKPLNVTGNNGAQSSL